MVKRDTKSPSNLPLFEGGYSHGQPSALMGELSDLESGVNSWNFEDPTPEETAEQQRVVDNRLFTKQMEDMQAEYVARTRKAKYQLFAKEVASRGISLSQFEQIDAKRKLLEKYFPVRFSPENQDLRQYSVAQIGRLFNSVLNYSKGYSKRQG